MKMNKKSFCFILALILLAAFIVWAFFNLSTISGGISFIGKLFYPFILGFIIAYILNIPMNFFQNKVFKKMSRRKAKNLSFLCIILLSLLVIAFFALILIPQLTHSIISLVQSMPAKLEVFQQKISQDENIMPLIREKISTISIDWEKISKEVLPIIQKNSGSVLNSAFSTISSAVQSVVTFFISLSIAIYLLTNWESAKASATNIINAYMPNKIKQPTIKFLGISNTIFSHFITLQSLECVIIAVLFAIALPIAGIKYWLIFSILMGILSIIPKFGSLFGLVISSFIILIEQDWVKVLIFIAIAIVISQINENFIYSKLVTSTIGIPEIGIMVASIFGGAFFGAMGAIVFIPLFGIFYTLLKQRTYKNLKEKDIPVQKSNIKNEEDLI